MKNYPQKVDFHVHSNISDGIFTPEEIIRITAGSGLAAVGLTDHDSINGLSEAAIAAKANNVELIPGVEISVFEENLEIHIIGYYPSDKKQLGEVLNILQKERFTRMEAIVGKLVALGIKISPEEVITEAGNAAPGRMHIARLLLRKKYIHNLNQAFSTYLNRNKPAFVPRKTFSIKQVMGLLMDVRALPVIAHPGEDGKHIINKLIPMGLKGVEAYHPDHSPTIRKYFQDLAREKGLLVTGGSDFHGNNREIINYPVNLAISAEYLTQMKQFLIKM